MTRITWAAPALLAVASCVAVAENPVRPNIIVMLADDLGFSDLGCYGGEIDTPHLDRLAAGGLRFTHGTNTARCWPTRAALLTGYYAQAIGRDALPGGTGGAQGRRPAWARLLPERLAPVGYRSYHSGKWHIDGDPGAQGFTRSFAVNAVGENDYFDAGGAQDDGRPIAGAADFYLTTAIDDTLVLFLSDNGASAEIMIRGEGHDPAADLGSRKTFLCLGPGWSTVANAPFRRHKTWVHEGGIATPWIVHWPNGFAARGELRPQPVHVIDLVPTVLDVAGVPAEEAQSAPPLHGRSFAAALGDVSAPPRHESLWWCHDGHRAVRVGDWKLVASRGRPWELYDLVADRCETRDQAAGQPDRVAVLEREWNRIADECRDRAASAAVPATRPNVVIVFCDDLGYGDPSCYGGKVPTPAIDRIGRAGIRFTDFHVPHPVCSASRAALLTGCHAPWVSIHGALFPTSTHGLAAVRWGRP